MNFYRRSLVNRFALSLAIVLMTAMGALVLIDRFVFLPLLLDGEQRLAMKQLDRLEQSFHYSSDAFLAHTRDWAHWDDSYRFMQGKHPSYATANFSREMFNDLQYQLMLYVNKERQVIWVAGINPDSGHYSQCETVASACAWASTFVQPLAGQLNDLAPSGKKVVLAEPQAAIAAMSPILRTDGSGPANGWLIQVRMLDDAFKTMLELQTGLPAIIGRSASTGGTPTRQASVSRDAEHVRVSRPLTVVSGGSSLYLGTQLPRELFRTGARTFQYAMTWTGLLLLAVIALVLVLLSVLVLRPLGLLTQFTREPGQKHTPLQADEMAVVPSTLRSRTDEFGTLARHMQSMLRYQHSQAATLLQLSLQDPLTGLANRRLFDTRLIKALQTAGNDECSVMMLDIDHFKRYNDHYGHAAGDSCLVQVAECMQEHFSDDQVLVARTGGEEFSVLLPDTSLDEACHLANTLRQRIEQLALPHEGSTTDDVVTMSIGVTSTLASGTHSTTTLMRNADRALYQAKAEGRNRVVCDRRSDVEASS